MNKMAFPSIVDDSETMSWDKGMTLRDYFAAKAMQEFLNFLIKRGWQHDDLKIVANGAYRMADAMLEERIKQ